MIRNARILATAAHAPDRTLPNQYFNDLLGEDVHTWLVENLTIRERRWCSESESTSDLAVSAAEKVIAKAGISPADLDLIIIATDTPEFISPSTASVVQHRIGAKNAGTFDVNTACAGFVTILDMGARYIRSDSKYNSVLVIGAYAMSKYLDMNDKKTVTLFADGAGAVLLGATDESIGFIDGLLHTEGQYNDWMGIYGGGTRFPVSKEMIDKKDHLLKFVRKFPKEINPQTWTRMIQEILDSHDLQPEDIQMYFFTQININSIRETLENLNLGMNRTHTIMDRFGYTGSACIPMAFAEAVELGKVKQGDKIVFMGSGGGLAFATALMEY